MFFSTKDENSSFIKLLYTFFIIFEAGFPYIYLSNDRDQGWITQGIRKSCQQKRSLYIINISSDNLMIKLINKSTVPF